MSQRFVFLDRDGTLVRDTGYAHTLADYALLPGVAPALMRLSDAGFGLAIVTNQSGIGRGMFGEPDFETFQRHLVDDLGARGVRIAASFHCPHAPDAGCQCRKPLPGLVHQARDALGADLALSWMIGDALRDVEAGQAAGVGGNVLLGRGPAPPGVALAADLTAAADLILRDAG